MSRVIYNNKIDKIKEFYQKGKTISEIARKFGIERDTVRSHLNMNTSVDRELKTCVICGKKCSGYEKLIKSLTCSDICHEDLLKSLSVWLEIPLRDYPVRGIFCLSGEPFQSLPGDQRNQSLK